MSIRDRAGYQVASDQMHIFGETFCENPLVTGAAGATLIAAGCTTLTGAVVLSVFMLFCLPIVGVIACKNPRCITTIEQELPHIFKLTNRQKGVYRCLYCESKA